MRAVFVGVLMVPDAALEGVPDGVGVEDGEEAAQVGAYVVTGDSIILMQEVPVVDLVALMELEGSTIGSGGP